MGIRSYIEKRLEKQDKERYESNNYPIKSKLFAGIMAIICIQTFGIGLISMIVLLNDTLFYLKSLFWIILAIVCIFLLIISNYFLYYRALRRIVKSYEDKYGSPGVGDKMQEQEKKKKNKELKNSCYCDLDV